MKKEIISKISFTLRAGTIAGVIPLPSILSISLPYEAAKSHCPPLIEIGAGNKAGFPSLPSPHPPPLQESLACSYMLYISLLRKYIFLIR